MNKQRSFVTPEIAVPFPPQVTGDAVIAPEKNSGASKVSVKLMALIGYGDVFSNLIVAVVGLLVEIVV